MEPLTLSQEEIAAIVGFDFHKDYAGLIWLGELALQDKSAVAAVALLLAVYGWMPTMVNSHRLAEFGDLEANLFIPAGNCQNPAEAVALIEELETPLVNNSWIGTSKFLHFLKPTMFPIWDSRVATARGYDYRNKYNTLEAYAAFLEYAHQRVGDPAIEQLWTAFAAVGLPQPTPIRCVDMVLYHRGGSTEIA